MTSEYIEKLYNSLAKVYDHFFNKVFDEGRALLPDLISYNDNQKILEVGVGTGLSLNHFSKDVNLTGIDLSQKMLDIAHKRVEKYGYKNIDLKKMNAAKLEFADDSFDVVLAAYFISTVPNPYICIEEMKRVCKSGGLIVIVNHFLSDSPIINRLEKAFSPLFYRLGFYSDLSLNDLNENCDINIEKVLSVNILDYWKAVVIRND